MVCTRIVVSVIFGLLLVAVARADSTDQQPNVLLIICDDQGWGDIGSHGNNQLDTPVLDRMAASGARFDRFFVSPVCAPTRASLLTGRYHLRSGVWGVTRGHENMRSSEVTLGEMFKDAGFSTGYFGKWHNGAHYPHHPNGQGFDEFFGFCGGHWNNYFDTTLERNGEPIRTTGYITDVLTEAALAFLTKNAGKPFFCYLAYNAPHSPWQVPDRYFDKYKARGLDDTTACAYGMVENLDENIGRLIKALDDLKLANDTVVLFLTDNGPNSDRYNGDMRGRKASLHEGGVRVPLFVNFPSRVPAGLKINHISAHVDILPTLADLCGIARPKDVPLDGISLAPLLSGKPVDWPDRDLFTFVGKGDKGAVRSPNWRCVKEKVTWELFDIMQDPAEKVNVAANHSDVVQRMSSAYDTKLKEVSQKGFDPIPIPIGHPEWMTVTAPGHEAFLHTAGKNGINYYGEHGWANDWIANWTDTDAYPWWEVDVVRPGQYEIALLYCCSKHDLGAKVKVEIGDASIEGTVTQENDPPIPIMLDRASRKETFDRDWAVWVLGQVKLSAGRSKLIVRALEKPGEHVMDLKAVRFRRME